MCHPHFLHAQTYPWLESSKSSPSVVHQPITCFQSPLGKPAGATSAGISSVYSGLCADGSAPVTTRCSTQFYYLPPKLPTAADPEPDNTKFPAVLFDETKMQTTGPVRNCTAREAAPVRALPAYTLPGACEHATGLFYGSTEDLTAKSKIKGHTGSGAYNKILLIGTDVQTPMHDFNRNIITDFETQK